MRRHQDWSCDVRYIEEHLLEDPRPVYVITVFENFSRMILFGAPEALATDGGGIFYSDVAIELYGMLGIRKERIDPGEPWENYAETDDARSREGSLTMPFPTHAIGRR